MANSSSRLSALEAGLATLIQTLQQGTAAPTAVASTTAPTAHSKDTLEAIWKTPFKAGVSSKNGVPFLELPIRYGLALNVFDLAWLVDHANEVKAFLFDESEHFTVTTISRKGEAPVPASEVRAFVRAKVRKA